MGRWADESTRRWDRGVLIFSITFSLGSSSRHIFIWLQGLNTAFVLFWVMWRQDVTHALAACCSLQYFKIPVSSSTQQYQLRILYILACFTVYHLKHYSYHICIWVFFKSISILIFHRPVSSMRIHGSLSCIFLYSHCIIKDWELFV